MIKDSGRPGGAPWVDRVSYAMIDVGRFDVVVLRYPKNPKVDFVKRVVGLPGDRVELVNGLGSPRERSQGRRLGMVRPKFGYSSIDEGNHGP